MTATVPVEFADAITIVEFKVSGSTSSKTLAGSIVNIITQGKHLVLSAIGHQAVGQAMKAIPIANGLLAPQGYQLAVYPAFEVKMIHTGDIEEERTAMRLQIVRISVR